MNCSNGRWEKDAFWCPTLFSRLATVVAPCGGFSRLSFAGSRTEFGITKNQPVKAIFAAELDRLRIVVLINGRSQLSPQWSEKLGDRRDVFWFSPATGSQKLGNVPSVPTFCQELPHSSQNRA